MKYLEAKYCSCCIRVGLRAGCLVSQRRNSFSTNVLHIKLQQKQVPTRNGMLTGTKTQQITGFPYAPCRYEARWLCTHEQVVRTKRILLMRSETAGAEGLTSALQKVFILLCSSPVQGMHARAHLPVKLHPKGLKPVCSETELGREKTTAKEVK